MNCIAIMRRDCRCMICWWEPAFCTAAGISFVVVAEAELMPMATVGRETVIEIDSLRFIATIECRMC